VIGRSRSKHASLVMRRPEQPRLDDPATEAERPSHDRRSGRHRASSPFEPQAPEDARRLADLLRQNFATVWRTVRRLGVPAQRADELVQETFITTARKLGQIQVGSERRYLISVAVRLAANDRRRQSNRLEVAGEWLTEEQPDPTPLSDELLELKRRRHWLDEAVSELPVDLRTVFVLYELEDLTGPEIAELLEIPPGTVASRLRRAQQAFRRALRRIQVRVPSRGGKP